MNWKYLVATVGLLTLLTTFLVIMLDVEAQDLGRTVLEKTGEMVGMQLEARDFTWSLRKGLVVKGVEASSRFPGSRMTVSVEQIAFEHELLPLLAGKLVIRRFTMKRPRGQIAKTQTGTGRASEKISESKGEPHVTARSKAFLQLDPYLSVSEFEIEEGAFTTRALHMGRDGITCDGLDLVFRELHFQPGSLTLLHGLVARAELQARALDVGAIQARNVRGQIDFDKGRITLPHVRYWTSSGVYQARVTADLNQIPFGYTLSVETSRFEVGSLLGSKEKLPGTLTFEVKGFGTDSRNALGHGVLRLNGGILSPLPIVVEIGEVVGRRGLPSDSFEPVELTFEVNRGQLVLPPFELRTQNALFVIGGSFQFDGGLSVHVTVHPMDGKPSRFRVRGSWNQPIVEEVTSNQ